MTYSDYQRRHAAAYDADVFNGLKNQRPLKITPPAPVALPPKTPFKISLHNFTQPQKFTPIPTVPRGTYELTCPCCDWKTEVNLA